MFLIVTDKDALSIVNAINMLLIHKHCRYVYTVYIQKYVIPNSQKVQSTGTHLHIYDIKFNFLLVAPPLNTTTTRYDMAIYIGWIDCRI